MKRLLKWLLRLVLLGVVVLGAFLVHVIWFKPYRIEWFYQRVFAEYVIDNPEMLSGMRILPSWLDYYSDDLSDASLAREEELQTKLRADLAMLRDYDRKALQGEEGLSYDVLEDFLATQQAGEAYRFHDFPLNQMRGLQSSLPNFMSDVHQVKNAGEGDNYIARLSKFPVKISQVMEGLQLRDQRGIHPPRFTVEKVLEQMRGFIATPAAENPLYTTFKAKLDKIAAADMDEATRQRLLTAVAAQIENSVYPAYRVLIGHFETLLPKATSNDGVWRLPDGDAYYQWCIQQSTTTRMSAEEIHDIGLAEVARIGAEMDAILRERGLVEGTLGERTQQISADPAQLFPDTEEGHKQLLDGYQAIIDEIDRGLGPAFDVRPKSGVEVRRVPEFSQKTAPGAYYQGPSMDGSRPGVFYANLRNMSETPRFTMRTLAYHEAIPGHHFQIAIAQELTGLPFFRRLIGTTAYSEGWALYAERLAWEMGFQKDPLDNLGRLRDEMMRAVRLVVDTGVHHKRWSREQAIAYMSEHTGMAETDVVAEIERYLVNPGQALGYKIGMLKILELREKAKQALGDKFELRQFHNEVLTHGALPMTLLERVVDEWIARSKG